MVTVSMSHLAAGCEGPSQPFRFKIPFQRDHRPSRKTDPLQPNHSGRSKLSIGGKSARDEGLIFQFAESTFGCNRYSRRKTRIAKNNRCNSLFIRYNAPMAVTRSKKRFSTFSSRS